MQQTDSNTIRPNYASSTLVRAVRDLSLAHSLEEITAVVRNAARDLVHADGATFVLRDQEQCHYVDEDAISPLWKGMKFPLSACISGWCMLYKEQLTIKDIYQDDRIPHDAYRPTFVKSLAMTPIRKNNPIGAIGTYWAESYRPSEEELEALQSLADSTSIAIKNINTLNKLKERTLNLERINQRLNRFTWIVSHDLKEPLRNINLNLSFLEGELLDQGKITKEDDSYSYFQKINSSIATSKQLISDLLEVTKLENYQHSIKPVDLRTVIKEVLEILEGTIKEKNGIIECEELPTVRTDPVLITRVFQNIIANAVKFHKDGIPPEVKINASLSGSNWVVAIKDSGIGIPEDIQHKVFDFFTHVHNRVDYPGSGVGLSICKKIIEDLGGEIWIDSPKDEGCTISFTLPRNVDEKF